MDECSPHSSSSLSLSLPHHLSCPPSFPMLRARSPPVQHLPSALCSNPASNSIADVVMRCFVSLDWFLCYSTLAIRLGESSLVNFAYVDNVDRFAWLEEFLAQFLQLISEDKLEQPRDGSRWIQVKRFNMMGSATKSPSCLEQDGSSLKCERCTLLLNRREASFWPQIRSQKGNAQAKRKG